jgi:hypothetical protein
MWNIYNKTYCYRIHVCVYILYIHMYLYFIHNNVMCQCVYICDGANTARLGPPKRVGKFNCTAFILLLSYLPPPPPPLCRYYTRYYSDARARPYCTRSRRVQLPVRLPIIRVYLLPQPSPLNNNNIIKRFNLVAIVNVCLPRWPVFYHHYYCYYYYYYYYYHRYRYKS